MGSIDLKINDCHFKSFWAQTNNPFNAEYYSSLSKSKAKRPTLLLLLFGQLQGYMLVSKKENQMSPVIDLSNKECLLERIYWAAQLSAPDISTLRAKAEGQNEII